MFQENTDREWEKWGSQNPYFAVLTHDKFKTSRLTSEVLNEFFSTGESDASNVFRIIHRVLDPQFNPKKTLDFGCGVGRLVIPFASRSESVVGVDVSNAMLMEAKKNCSERGVANVQLLQSDDFFNKDAMIFDFIHSYIVFQHIPVEKGVRLFQSLLVRLAAGGVGAIHFTYVTESEVSTNRLRKKLALIKKLIPFYSLFRTMVRQIMHSSPGMQMNGYNLNRLLRILQLNDVRCFYSEFTDHGGIPGVFLYFQKEVK